MANQDKDQAKIRPNEHNPNRDAKSGLAGPELRIGHSLKSNPMRNGRIKVKRTG